MKASKGGYRETESGLDASFLWSHDKSEKEGEEGGRRGKRGWKIEKSCKATREGETEELVLLVVKRFTEYKLLWRCKHISNRLGVYSMCAAVFIFINCRCNQI